MRTIVDEPRVAVEPTALRACAEGRTIFVKLHDERIVGFPANRFRILAPAVQAGHRLRFRPGTSFTLLVQNLVFKVRSSRGCGNGGKTFFVFPRFPQPVRQMGSFSSMPTCGRANVFSSFIEYPKEM